MKAPIQNVFLMVALLTGLNHAAAQESRYFRISGPAATTIIAFQLDGMMSWSNAQPGTNYTVQTATSLTGGTNWVDYIQLPVTNGFSTNQIIDFNLPTGMAFIPAGLFTMGNSIGDDSDINDKDNPTNVTVSAFYMDVNLVSYSQWQSVFNWAANNGYNFVNAGSGKAANHPVVNVDWYDAVKWCNARAQQAGLTPAYYTDTNLTQLYTNGETDAVYVNWTASGYRLPTEAEWEKAARGGLNGKRFPWGNTISETQANYEGNTAFSYDFGPDGFNAAFNDGVAPLTSPIGYFEPNGYGLYDMSGDVAEWCWDWRGTYAGGSDPRGPASGFNRVMRGGSWDSVAASCFERGSINGPNTAFTIFGFRCAKTH